MKKLIQPACLLLYPLSLLVFFITGMFYASAIGAGEGQGLAGGAIVVGYGIMAALGALVAALFFAYYAATKNVVIANWVLVVVFLVFVVITNYTVN